MSTHSTTLLLLCAIPWLLTGCDSSVPAAKRARSPTVSSASGKKSAADKFVPRDPITVESCPPRYDLSAEVTDSVSRLITAMESDDSLKSNFCVESTVERPWGPSTWKSTHWFGPVTFDGRVFHGTFKRHVDPDVGRKGDKISIARDHVTNWMYLDGGMLICATETASHRQTFKPPQLVDDGIRTLTIGTVQQDVPWYRIDTSPLALQNPIFWATLPYPDGTACAEVGRYTTIEWNDFSEDNENTYLNEGIAFDVGKNVGIGQGDATLVHWKFEYEGELANEATFLKGSRFVFCFDKQTEMRGITLGGVPGSDVRAERDNLIGIIEIGHLDSQPSTRD